MHLAASALRVSAFFLCSESCDSDDHDLSRSWSVLSSPQSLRLRSGWHSSGLFSCELNQTLLSHILICSRTYWRRAFLILSSPSGPRWWSLPSGARTWFPSGVQKMFFFQILISFWTPEDDFPDFVPCIWGPKGDFQQGVFKFFPF